MSSLDALATPCLLVEQDRLRRNLTRMQETADANDVTLRPHVKTHKSVDLARRQRERGAAGLPVATVEEAAAFVEAGAEDVRVAYPVTGRDKHEQLAALRDRARLSCTVDTAAGAEQAAAVHSMHERPLDVLMEVDVVHDAMQVGLGAASLADCALTVLTTVVSVKERPDGPDRAFVDAGKKVFTTDTGYDTDGHGVALRDAATMSPSPDLRVVRLSEEHGWLDGPDAAALSVGERLRIVPNHACVCIATQARLHVVDGTTVVDTWPVARGV